MNLKRKTAIVTGASQGIGSNIAQQLGDLGIAVVVNYLSNREEAEKIVRTIKANGGEAMAIKADISNVQEIEHLFKTTIEEYGTVNILINNAGIMITKPILDIREEDFDKQFSINVKGTFFSCQQAYKYMEESGKIINFSTSVVGQMFPNYSFYAATKGAIEQLTRQLAKEFGKRKININAIAPGPIATNLFLNDKSPEEINGIVKANSFGRIGETQDISNIIKFLISDDSNWITGQTIRVNGGFI